MPLISLEEFKASTHKYFSRRDGAIKVIDDKLDAVHRNGTYQSIQELRAAIDAFKTAKDQKHGDYTKSKREGGEQENITKLDLQVKAEETKMAELPGDIAIMTKVCTDLFDVKIADVDFSESVKSAAKAKQIGGKSLHQTVHDDWLSDARLADYQEHEASMTQAKLKTVLPMGPQTISLTELGKIGAVVKKHRYAVCESITATIISDCKKAGFKGKLEWAGIPYGNKSGHSIVIGYREGDVKQPSTWGLSYFFADLWYYNLGMRKSYLIRGSARSGYVNSDVTPYLATSGGPKIMASIA